MTLDELKQVIREQLQEILVETTTNDASQEAERMGLEYYSFGRWGKLGKVTHDLQEKSVPEPYDRKNKRKMTAAQIRKRDKVGKAMEKNEKTVARFRDKHGDDWRDYLWAAASGIALRSGKRGK